jgi:excisionase family DNA binding protein
LNRKAVFVITEEKRFYSVEELSSMFGVSEESVRRWIRGGELRAYRLGRRELRISKEDLDRFLEARRVGDE